MTRFAIGAAALLSFLFSPFPSRACQFPIHPVDVELRGYPTELRVRIENNAVFWRESILGGPPPPGGWPRPMAERAEAYVDGSFSLSVDGRRLKGRLVRARYVQEPWKDELDARVVLELVYPVPEHGSRVTGKSAFFAEFHEHLEKKEGGHRDHAYRLHAAQHGVKQEFFTRLRVSGRASKTLTLLVDEPGFDLAFEDVLRTPLQEAGAAGRRGLCFPAERPALILFILAGVLYWGGRRSLYAAVASAAGFAVLVSVLPPVPETYYGALRWLAVAASALAARQTPGIVWYCGIQWAGLPLWASEAGRVLSSSGGRPLLDGIAFVLGFTASSALLAGVFAGLLLLYRRRLRHHSEALCGRMFDEHRRAAATLLAAAAAVLLGKAIITGAGT